MCKIIGEHPDQTSPLLSLAQKQQYRKHTSHLRHLHFFKPVGFASKRELINAPMFSCRYSSVKLTWKERKKVISMSPANKHLKKWKHCVCNYGTFPSPTCTIDVLSILYSIWPCLTFCSAPVMSLVTVPSYTIHSITKISNFPIDLQTEQKL